MTYDECITLDLGAFTTLALGGECILDFKMKFNSQFLAVW